MSNNGFQRPAIGARPDHRARAAAAEAER